MANEKEQKTGSRTEKKKKNKKVSFWRLAIIILLLLFFIAGAAGIGVVMAITSNLPNWEPSDFSTAHTTFVYDSDGLEVTQLHAGENRTPIHSINEVPDDLRNAFLAIEDYRFYDHWGVDFRALTRAVVANIQGGFGSQGASTITQQLVKNAMLTPEKNIERKMQEVVLALQVERMYTKNEILTHYLNWVYFGHGAYGIVAAADTYFGKELDELTLAESATLAGLVQRPNALSPYRNPDDSMNRRALVLNNMVRYEFITASQSNEAKIEEFELPGLRQASHPFPYFVDYVIDQSEQLLEQHDIPKSQLRTGGLRVYTTLDRKVQGAAEKAFADASNFPDPRPNEENKVQGAMAIVDHRTGHIKALVGGREHTTERGLNRATQGLRQPGSAFKPIVSYGPAVELGYSPGSVLDDVPVQYRFSNQTYTPQNLGNNYRGLVTMREALTRSINVTAVSMLDTIGIDAGYDFAERLGIPLDPSGDRGLGISLGGLTKGVSPLAMASAFGAFANEGMLVESHAITKITDTHGNVLVEVKPNKNAVMSEDTAFLMTDMMKSVVDSGTGTRARIPGRPVAGKTGTTQLPDLPEFRNVSGSRDVWFAGYTPELSAAVWIGYDRTDINHYLYKVYGGNHPASLFKLALEEALQDVPVTQFSRPSTIVSVAIDTKSGLLPSELTPDGYRRSELFARSNMPTELSDVWVREEVCANSGNLATEFCPDVESKVFLQRPTPFTTIAANPRVPQDAALEVPTETCDIHGLDNVVLVDICTHPDHQDHFFRANVGPDSQGCPDEFVEQQAFPIYQAPQNYCPIPDHQSGTSSGNTSSGRNGDNNQEPETPGDVEAPGQSGNQGNQGNQDSQDNQDVAPISSLRGEVTSNDSNYTVQLNWNHSRNGSQIEYAIYRSSSRNFAPNEHYLLATTTRTSYQDTAGLELDNNYFYKIIAYHKTNNKQSSPSPELAITIRN